MMGLEEHLITMFRDDFEFGADAAPSHLGAGIKLPQQPAPELVAAAPDANRIEPVAWAPEAEKELSKIPFFVRGKARRNTERYAQETGVALITVEALYDAKAHFSR
jgi:light-independent protochlorophyllide reductase subunit B